MYWDRYLNFIVVKCHGMSLLWFSSSLALLCSFSKGTALTEENGMYSSSEWSVF